MNGLINNKGVIIYHEEYGIHQEYYALCFDYALNLLNNKTEQ